MWFLIFAAMQIVIIGGGASGFFCAINIAQRHPNVDVTILEKSSKLLSKVRISGGGRCNVTNNLPDPKELTKRYPRGGKEMLGPFHQFSITSTIEWFKDKGVALKAEADGRMFPVTDSSETIIECFTSAAESLGIDIQMNINVTGISPNIEGFQLSTNKGSIAANYVVVATGGNTDKEFKETLMKLGHTLSPAVPSLFTFNVPNHPINQLMGVSVPNAIIKISNSKLKEEGPLLITHWGFSGPAVLRLSAWGAKHLAQCNYNFNFTINWNGEYKAEDLLLDFLYFKQQHQQKNVLSATFNLPKRLWAYLIDKCGIMENSVWQNISKSQLQKLAQTICHDSYDARGKTTYKEEFVTCGGVNLKEIDFKTLQSKMLPRLYFAGEVIDVDGITGGFNFQNAWTTGWIAANSISEALNK